MDFYFIVSRWGADGMGYLELKSELTALPASRMIAENQSNVESLQNTKMGGKNITFSGPTHISLCTNF